MVICRKEKLEEVGGFDESLAYGEDGDLGRRILETDPKNVYLDHVCEYASLVSSLRGVFRQGRWYGKSMPQYFRKHPEAFLSLLSIGFFVVLPLMTIGAYFSQYLLYLAALQHLAVLTYVLEGIRRTRILHMVFVPLIKVIRSYAEVLGMVEGLFTDDLGRE